MNKELLADILEWDILNWSKVLEFWELEVDVKNKNYQCLELGNHHGGLSLWLAINGNRVICPDKDSPEEKAKIKHQKYKSSFNVEYLTVDATNIPYENHFDVVVFKSILGGISANGEDHLKLKVIDEIYKSLKPNSVLLFAENLEASRLHMMIRKRFVQWGKRWNYLKYEEVPPLFSAFKKVKFKTSGFLGAFGRNEKQRNFFSRIDQLIDGILPPKKRYILYGYAKK